MKKLTKSQRRIAIVKDAIIQLQIGSYKTGDFGYLTLSDKVRKRCDKIESAQEALSNIDSKSFCGICAKGSLLLSTIRKENEFDSINLVSDSSVVMNKLTTDNLFNEKNSSPDLHPGNWWFREHVGRCRK